MTVPNYSDSLSQLEFTLSKEEMEELKNLLINSIHADKAGGRSRVLTENVPGGKREGGENRTRKETDRSIHPCRECEWRIFNLGNLIRT